MAQAAPTSTSVRSVLVGGHALARAARHAQRRHVLPRCYLFGTHALISGSTPNIRGHLSCAHRQKKEVMWWGDSDDLPHAVTPGSYKLHNVMFLLWCGYY
jgi:hypothetical protein